MTDIYKCKHCNEIFEKVFEGSACNESGCACEDLDLLAPKTADWKTEKHVPVIEKVEGGTKVIVGSSLHPMTNEHWITMVELIDGNKAYRAYLNPGDEPGATFPVPFKEGMTAREYCNVHGLWATQ